MKQIYNFFKVKMCYRTYWKQWLAFFSLILILVLFSEYNANETQKMLDAKEEEIDEKIRIAKESKRIQNSQIDISE